MRTTRIVTSFLKDDDKFLILKRSKKVKTMKELWAGISGIIENKEEPLSRAKIEIYEELGIKENQLKLINSAEKLRIISPQYQNHEWEVFPFLFEVKNPKIKLNWENSEYRWIAKEELTNYQTVPNLDRVLLNLL